MPFIPYKAKEPKTAPPSGVQVRIRLPEEVLNHYQQYADQRKESVEDVIDRVGRDKLGVELTPVRRLTSGTQDRSGYRLNMELWEASMQGTPTYREWQWAPLDLLQPGAAAGSLCCGLALKSKSRASL